MTRLQPGEIALIDHEDIDRVAAEGLVQRQARAVVNASRSSTGRYPNLGPLLLITAGIPVVDDVGPEVMNVGEGTRVAIDGDKVIAIRRGPRERSSGRATGSTRSRSRRCSTRRSDRSPDELERFAENTIEYIKDERDVLLEAARLPEVSTDFHGRHVLIVVRGYDYKEDLAALRSYIREVRPILIGVDGGADALLDAG